MRSVKSYSELQEHEQGQAEYRPGKCETGGGHVVARPSVWPPVLRHAGNRDKGKFYGSARCQKCGAVVVIYDPLQTGVRFADDAKADDAKAPRKV